MSMVTSNVDREVCARACERHNVAFNQSRTRAGSGQQWGPWCPPECPQCTEETKQRLEREERDRKFNEEVLPEIKAEILAESDRECDAEEGRDELTRALAEAQMPGVFAEWWALNLRGFIARADSEDRAAKDAKIIARRREEFFAQEEAAADRARSELQVKLGAERERKIKESLASWMLAG